MFRIIFSLLSIGWLASSPIGARCAEMVLPSTHTVQDTIPVPGNHPAANVDMNWISVAQFRASGVPVAEQKKFYNYAGRLIQSQYRDIEKKHVLASEIIYDAANRPAVQTLTAPINNGGFAYQRYFTDYSYRDFDQYTTSTSVVVDKSRTPEPIEDNILTGKLGWYYSANNNWEPYQDITDYPYSRQLYTFDGINMPIKTSSPGNEYRLGKGHETAQYSVKVISELDHYVQVRNKFFTTAELGQQPTTLKNQAVQYVYEDENRKQSIVIKDKAGNVLMTALPGNELTVQNADSNTVENRPFVYFILLPNGHASGNAGGAWEVWDVLNDQLATQEAPGYYRLNATSYAGAMVQNHYGTIAYYFYNQLGQLVATLPPEGVKKLLGTGLNNYATKEDIPYVTLYEYDLQGRLVSTTGPESGKTEFVYRQDGNVRFSQNAHQRTDGRYSYVKYDGYGRTIESGEYKPGTGGVPFNADLSQSSTMKSILEFTDANGGLINGTQYGVVRIHYDLTDNSHGQSGYTQDGFFLRDALSMTEKYRTVVNNTASSANLVSRSWYNYDGQGQMTWSIVYLNGLGYKTTDYTYDELGNVTKVIYQKNTAAERFVHYYAYDADLRLSAVYTNTVDNSSTKVIQAKYLYYLHGPLKRIELADQLQGIDYTYTVDGKLKTINHADKIHDPGNDGSTNGFAPDVFGMNVEYHPNDYVRSGTSIGSVQNASYPPLYNGRINGLGWYSKKPASITGLDATVMNAYRYDPKYQLESSGWGTPSYTADTYTEQAGVYKEHGLTYDDNGNILTLKRNNSTGTVATQTYNYLTNTNKLASVSGYATYTYDNIGRLASQIKGGQGMYLSYDASDHVTEIYSDLAKSNLMLSFGYDEQGRRIRKEDHRNGAVTWYVYSAGGSVQAIYDNHGGGAQQLREQPVYGAGRVGVYFRQAASYQYELSDHLGNVRAVVNRAKLPSGEADVLYYADYYPYGLVLRSGGTDWRYGYQGQYAEDDPETGWNVFELRNYDAAIGRWLTMDAAGQYHSPYLGMGNDPINSVDPDGNWSFFGATWRQALAFVSGQNPTRISKKGGEYGFYTRSGGVADGEAKIYATANFKPRANLADQIIAPNLTPVGQFNPATGMIQGSGQISPVYIEFDIALTAYTLGGYVAGRAAMNAAKGGYSTIYRAVSQAEADDIAKFGFRMKAGGYESGKLFAPTLQEAAQFGKYNFGLDGIPNSIIKVRAPNSILNGATKFGADGMNAISIPANQLNLLKGTPLNYSPLIR